MKKIYKYASALLITGALSVMVVLNADAQRGGSHASSGGGGGASFSRGGSGGGGSFSGGASFGGSRSSIGLGLGLSYGRAFGRPGYNYIGYPYSGFYLNALPYGYYPFYMGASLFYYSDGIFYRPYDDGGYVVTAPPVGAAVPQLPKGAKGIMIDNQQYFEYNGVYYKIVLNDKGDKVFVVAGKDGVLNTDNGSNDDAVSQTPRVGDVVDRLPDGVRKVTLNGKKYFVSADDIYYERVTDSNGNTGFRIASVPDSE
ncbi:MAG: DUF6515 family protein [Bacteroidota bacterium]